MCVCVSVGLVPARSFKTSWKQRVNFPGSCRVCWARTCAHFTPQTGITGFLTLFCVLFNRLTHTRTHPILCKYIYKAHELVMNPFHFSLLPFCSLNSADISHIQGNLEEISTFQQMLVQSLEEHTKSVSVCCLQMRYYLINFINFM